MKASLTVLFFLLVSLAGGAARADRDILYAARYYLPPGVRKTSHFHLYRINADGTRRTQITFADVDDSDPAWSPDGKQIVFEREGRGVCLVEANGGPVRTIVAYPQRDEESWESARWLPTGKTIVVHHAYCSKEGSASAVYLIDMETQRKRRLDDAADYQMSPDGHFAYLRGDESEDRIQDLRTGAYKLLTTTLLTGTTWLDDQTLVGLDQDPATSVFFMRFVGTDGRQKRRLALRFPKSFPGLDVSEDDAAERGGVFLSGPRGTLIFALNNHNSTVGADYLFFIMLMDGNPLAYLTEGQFLAWPPDGAKFATAPGRDLTDYDGKHSVWTAPLFVRAAGGGPMQQITPRLSWVTGADWRRTTPAER